MTYISGNCCFLPLYFLLSETCQPAVMSSPFPPAKTPCSILKSSTCSHTGPVNFIDIKVGTGFENFFCILDFRKGSSPKTSFSFTIFINLQRGSKQPQVA